jgi:two-component system, cell cycle sensor histidine kinase and response regulator CckA
MNPKPTYEELERKVEEFEQAEEALKESEARFRLLFNNSADGHVLYKGGQFIDCNRSALQMLGFSSREDLLGLQPGDVSPTHQPDGALSKEKADSMIRLALERGSYRFEWLCKRADGSDLLLDILLNAFTEKGEILIHAVWRDMTERKRTKEEFEQIFSMSLDMLCIADIATSTFIKVNPAFTDTLGFTEEELLEKPFISFVHPDDIEATVSVIENKSEMGEKIINFENRYQCRDGTYRWLSWVSHPYLEKGITYAVARDITEQKRAEKELIESKLLLDATGRMARVGGWELDAETLEVSWTEETYRIHEVPLDSKPPLEEALSFYHPDDRERLSRAIQRALGADEPYDLELRFITANGNELWTRTMCRPQIIDGRVVRLRGTFQDITDRKLANEALRESEEKFRSLVDQASEMLFLHDLQGHLVDVNIAAARNTGYAKEELTKMTVFDIDPDAGDRGDMRKHWEALRGDDPPVVFEVRHKRKDGSIYPAEVCVSKIALRDGEYILGLARDITERKQAETTLLETQRRTASILGGIADTFYSLDNDWRFTTVNPAAERAPFGRPASELIGRVIWELYPDLVGTKIHRHYLDAVEKRSLEHYEAQSLLNGRWYEFFMQGWEGGVDVYMRDVTERKKAEAALFESEEKYRILFNTFPLGITVSDESGKIVEANDTAAKLLGISRDEHMSRSIDSSEWRIIDSTRAPMPPEDYASVRALKENRLIENVEMGIVKPEGETTWISVTASPLPLENYGVVVTYGDITDRKRIEQQYQTLFREMIDGFAVHKIICNERDEPVDYRFLAVNPAFERMTGLKAEGIIGKTVKEVLPNTEPYWIQKYGRVALTGESITFENYSQEFDRYFYVTAFRPAINQFACIFVDITERKRSEKALLESEKKYRLLADNVRDVIWMRDLDLKLTYVSPSIEVFSGYTVEEALDRNLAEVLTPDSARLAVETFTDAMQDLKSGMDLRDEYEIDLEHISKDGRKLWMQCKVSPLRDDKGKVVGMLGVSRDITDRKEAERALWESEEKFRLTFISSPDSVNINRLRDGLYIDINEGFTLLTGFTRQDVIGKTSEEIQIWADMADRRNLVRMLEEKGVCENLEARFRRKDGSLTTALMSARVISLQGEPHIISITRDISDRIEAEAAIRKSEEEHRSILKTAMDGFCLINLAGRLIEVNETYCQMSGYSEQELLSRKLSDLETLETAQETIAHMERIIEHGEDRFETVQRRKDGKLFNVEVSVQYNAYEGGRFIAFLRDITERKASEKSLRQIGEKYRQIFENIQDVYYESGLDGRILEVSPSIERMSEYRREDLLGKSLYDIYANPEERTGFVRQILEKGRLNEYEISLKDKDGSMRPCSVTTSIVRDEQGKPVKLVGSMRDISDRKQSEKETLELKEQLHRAQKMEAMGLLAGGVAHDLNNILSGIVSYPELLLMDLPENSPLRKPITTIRDSGMRAADVVADLLTIARGVAIGRQTLNLNRVVDEYLDSPEFNKLKKSHIFVDFRTELNKDVLNTKGSPVHLKKALMNLVVNAAEAIEKSGTVTISTCNRYLDEPFMGYENVRRGEYTVLSVSDDGSGISPHDLERIFEPFYTKKVMGKSGTGLGLAVVWNTIQDHNGYINVKTSEKGTTFELYFPVTREDIAEKMEAIGLEAYMGHGERILVVDDEETQREIAAGILAKLGYRAEAVPSGEEAIAYVKRHPVDLIVLDMVMPKGMNGRETYEEIIKIRPGQKAVIASGYAKTGEVDAAQRLGAGKYIKKPYTLEKIGVAVKDQLER